MYKFYQSLLYLSYIFIFFNVDLKMGACLNSPSLSSSTHPILGPIQEVQLLNRSLIRIVDFSLSEIKLKKWQNTLKQLQQKKPHLQSILFLPIFHQTTFTCSLTSAKEFYFQNYRQNLMIEKQEKDFKGIGYSEERIKEIGQVLFKLIDENPEIDEELGLENVVLNDDGKIKIALKKYLPQIESLQINKLIESQKKLKWSQDTDYSTSPRLSLTNLLVRRSNLRMSVCRILLSLVKETIRYSSLFMRIRCELGKAEKDWEALEDYFLQKRQKNPKNYFLDIPYIESFNDKSNDTSLFLVTESGWTDYNNS